MLAVLARKAGAEISAICLMPNHVHIIIIPSHEDGLRQTFADAHRRYTSNINARLRVTCYLWQSRFEEKGTLPNVIKLGADFK